MVVRVDSSTFLVRGISLNGGEQVEVIIRLKKGCFLEHVVHGNGNLPSLLSLFAIAYPSGMDQVETP